MLLVSETGLNSMLEELNVYSLENLLEINLEKTKCMFLTKREDWLGENSISEIVN